MSPETKEHYYIAGYWGRRRATVDDCAAKATEFLESLAEIEETFRTWFHTADSEEEALSRPFRIDQASLREELLASRSRRDSDNSIVEELGFNLAMWTG